VVVVGSVVVVVLLEVVVELEVVLDDDKRVPDRQQGVEAIQELHDVGPAETTVHAGAVATPPAPSARQSRGRDRGMPIWPAW